jgi:hypothetical protein
LGAGDVKLMIATKTVGWRVLKTMVSRYIDCLYLGNKGRLQLALRNSTDSHAVDLTSSKGVISDDIIEIDPLIFKPRPIKQRMSKHKVEIIRGTSQESTQLKI